MTHPAALILGALAITWSLAVFLLKRNRFRRWFRASGIIVGIVPIKGNDPEDPHNITPHPRITFTTASGQTVEFVPSSYSALQGVGDNVTVLYDPSDPKNAIVDGFIRRHMGESLLFCLGLGVAAFYVFHPYFK